MLLMPADHYIGNLPAFHEALARAAREAEAGRIVTFGVDPTRPETGYGYIRRGAESSRAPGLFEVERFYEKPDQDTAARFLADGGFYWNAGIFLAKPAVILSEFQRLAAPLLAGCRNAVAAGHTSGDVLTLDRASFEALPPIAFDRAVMEKTSLASVASVAMDWCDIGSWEAVWELSEKDGENNVAEGKVFLEDCRNSLVRAESRLVAVIGVDDLVVVETADAVLVMPRAQAQRLSDIVPQLRAKTRLSGKQF
jgi:mannose-1-phosphate guanylyltransferase/mannose-6-phosphate isomerase